jgi:3D (Asp-Asp-Asp) domain-containing protein
MVEADTGLRKQIEILQEQVERNRPPNRGGERPRKMTVEATAYCKDSCGKEPDDPLYGITASGQIVQDGMIAAGPELKMGTKVYIPYFGKIYTVTDRGGAIDNGDIDVYMESAAECWEFGRRQLDIYIMDWYGMVRKGEVRNEVNYVNTHEFIHRYWWPRSGSRVGRI